MKVFHALATLCPLSKVYVQTFATFAALCLDFRRLNFGSRLRNMGRSSNTARLSKFGHVAYISIQISNGTAGPRINNGTQQINKNNLQVSPLNIKLDRLVIGWKCGLKVSSNTHSFSCTVISVSLCSHSALTALLTCSESSLSSLKWDRNKWER